MSCGIYSAYQGSILLFLQVLAIGYNIHTAQGLIQSQADAIVNENCSNFLRSQHTNFNYSGSILSKGYWKNTQLNYERRKSHFNGVGDTLCPPWYQRTEDGTCAPGNEIVIAEKRTSQTLLQTFYCMTTSVKDATNRSDVIGSCLFTFNMDLIGSYYPLPCNVTRLNNYTCGGLNREGQLCGRCMKGFAPPVYSYALNCVNCTDYHLNWLKYIGVAFGPLTLFCILICIFHISATSAYLHGFIFFSQIFTMPIILRMEGHLRAFTEASHSTRSSELFYVSILGIWNLDMFRVFYKPFCIHPNMTVVQALALDYIIALYPLVLLVITYGLVSLHSRNNRIIVTLWRPFTTFLRPFIHNFNIEKSLIESFATLYHLSMMKMQSVTLDLLSPTVLYHIDGHIDDKLFLYLAGDMEYFGSDHMPYAILALFFSTVFLLIPGLLLFFYPCHLFQHFLNKIHCNFLALRTFMDVFQGHYKDGTNNTRDYRFFSGIFFWTRYILVTIFIVVNSQIAVLGITVIITVLGFAVTILHPQRKQLHYTLDCIVLFLISFLLFAYIGDHLSHHSPIPRRLCQLLVLLAYSLPLLYIVCLVCYWTIAEKRIPQKFIHFILKRSKNQNNDEQQGLLIYHTS